MASYRKRGNTWRAKRLDVLPLAKMIGHRDLKMLMVYYNPRAEDLAGDLG